MMIGPGRQERTRQEFEELFARSGLRLKRVMCHPIKDAAFFLIGVAREL
jgi:hypothetical protein